MSTEIDFVVTWVDGSDPEWRKEKACYSPKGIADDNEVRYRDWDIFRYWFRGVEKFALWVRKIHFVTWGHLPSWLDTSNPKLHIVNHKDYLPKDILPTYNSTVLELYLHKIPDLAEKFVYFNDDMMITKPMKPEDFFIGGKPCDMLAFQPVVANPKNPTMTHHYINTSLVLCKYFDKRKNVIENPGNYFKIGYPPLYFFYNMLELGFPLYTGFYTVHGPSPFCKRTFETVWEKESELLKSASCNRFRSDTDIPPNVFREWQKLSGDFVPKNVQKFFKYYELGRNEEELFKDIRKQTKKVICINDGEFKGNAEELKCRLHRAFEAILPEKSSFEK